MTNEIIAVLIIVSATVSIPPIFLSDHNLGYIDCLKGWCILLAIIIGITAVVLAIFWAFAVLFGG